MPLSNYDINNISTILSGQNGDWFSANLLRLMVQADDGNLEKLASAFPEEFIFLMRYKFGGVPVKFASLYNVYHTFHRLRENRVPDLMWEKGGKLWENLKFIGGRDF